METIDDETFVKDVCKPGHGADTCRYLLFGGDWQCGKHDPIHHTLDARVAAETMNARGDNCNGWNWEVA